MPPIAYDLIALAIIALLTFLGYRKGAFLTICGLIATLVAFVGALYISNLFCEPVGQLMTSFVRAPIEDIVSATLEATKNDSEFIEMLCQNPVVGGFVSQMEDKLLVEGLAPVTANVSAFVALQLARIILFFIGFFVVIAAWTVLSHAMNLAFYLPVLSSVNAIAGGCIGFIEGLAVAYVLAWAVSYGLLSPEQMDSTILIKFFVSYTPLALLAEASGAMEGMKGNV